MDLLEKLKAGKNVTKTVTLHGIEFGMKLLSDDDYLEAGFAVIDVFKARGIDDVNMASSDLFEAEKSTQLLLRALVVPGGVEALSPSPAALRRALSRDDKAYLTAEYLEFEKEYSPLAGRNMDEKQFNDLFNTLKKTPETVNLNDLNSETLRKLITALVFQQES